jgi:polyhydroxybutyrate depolymerase
LLVGRQTINHELVATAPLVAGLDVHLTTLALVALAMGGCAPTRGVSGEMRQAAGRPFRAVAPTALAPGQRVPVLVVLHGLGSSPEKVARYYGLEALVEELGLVVAYPEGTEEARGTGWFGRRLRFWNATDWCCNFQGSTVDDVAYLDAVLDDLQARYPVDLKRVYLMGLSNGGYMAHRYACDRADRVAAIASQAGAMWADAGRCRPSEAVAVLQLHGTDDFMVPYRGMPPRGPGGPSQPSARQTVLDWVGLDRCELQSDTTAAARDLFDDVDGDETTIERWGGCRGVELWTLHGAPHVPRPRQPDFARAVVGWLLEHPKP